MKNKKGLTLIELIVSIALISIVVVFLFQLLIELRYQNLNDTSKVEYKVASTIITQKIQNILLDEKIDLVETCDLTNTCIKITFISGNYLEIKITNDDKVLSIMKKDSSDNIILQDVRQIPEKDETGYIGKYDDLAYTTSAFTPTNSSYDYKYDSLLKLEVNMYDSLNNVYPIAIYYPYTGGTDFSTMYLNNVRYIKDCVNGSTASTNNHWVELKAFSNDVNVALNKTVTGTSSYNASYKPYTAVTDGDINSANYSQASISTGLQCVTVDLAQTYNLDKITVWHYYADGRIYYSNTTYVSSDNVTWKLVMANLDSESSLGKSVTKYDLNRTIEPIYRVSNMVVNGSLEPGTTNWILYTGITRSNIRAKDGTYSIRNYQSSALYQNANNEATPAAAISGNKYYIMGWLYTVTKGTTGCYMDANLIYNGAAHWQGPVGGFQSNLNVWEKQSKIYTMPSGTSPSIAVALAVNTQTGVQECFADAALAIDLTATFGAGKEPSQAWCDANLSYFDGSQNLNLIP